MPISLQNTHRRRILMTYDKNQLESFLQQIAFYKKQITHLQNELKTIKASSTIHKNCYSNYLESIGTAMLVCDVDRTIIGANSKIGAVTGYSREEVLEKNKWHYYVSQKVLNQLVTNHTQRRINPHSIPNEYEFQLIDKQGNIRDIFIHVSIIPGTQKSLFTLTASIASCPFFAQ